QEGQPVDEPLALAADDVSAQLGLGVDDVLLHVLERRDEPQGVVEGIGSLDQVGRGSIRYDGVGDEDAERYERADNESSRQEWRPLPGLPAVRFDSLPASVVVDPRAGTRD